MSWSSERLCATGVSFCSERGLTEYAPFLLSDLVKRSQTTLHTASKIEMHSERYSCLFSLISKETAHPLLNTLTRWWPSPWRVRLYAGVAAGRESSSCATSEAPSSWGQCPFFGGSERSEVGKASCKERATRYPWQIHW